MGSHSLIKFLWMTTNVMMHETAAAVPNLVLKHAFHEYLRHPNSLYKIPEPSRYHVEFSGVDYVGPLGKVKESVKVVAGKIPQMEFSDRVWSSGPYALFGLEHLILNASASYQVHYRIAHFHPIIRRARRTFSHCNDWESEAHFDIPSIPQFLGVKEALFRQIRYYLRALLMILLFESDEGRDRAGRCSKAVA